MARRVLSALLLLGLALALLALGSTLRGRGRAGDLRLVDTRGAVETLLAERDEPGSNVSGRGVFRVERLDEATARTLFPMPEHGIVYNPWCYYRLRPGLAYEVPWPEHPRGAWTRRTNSIGLREDDDLDLRGADVRVLVTGDSHVDGVCDNGESFVNRLEALLAARHPDQRVVALNAGVTGYSFYNYLGVLEEALAGAHGALPQVFVVTVYGGNDFVEVLRLQHYFRGTQMPPRSTHYWDRIEAAKRVSTNALGQGLNQTAFFLAHPEQLDVALEASRAVLHQIVRRCREHGIRPIVLHLPAAFDRPWPELEPLMARALEALELEPQDLAFGSELEGHLRDQVAEIGAEYLDLAERFAQGPPCYWTRDLHLDLRGHELTAQALLEVLERAPPAAAGDRSATRPDGPFEERDADGTLRVEGAYLGGLRQGRWIAYHRGGGARYAGEYVGGLREGPWEWWYPGGQLQKRGAYRANLSEGPWEEWYRDGTPRRAGAFAAGAAEGPWQEWYADGRLASEGRFERGEFEGEWTLYHPSGSPESRTNWRAGRREGPSESWFEDGSLRRRGAYRDDRREGPWVHYWPSGAVRSESTYVDGRREGPVRVFDAQGSPDPELTGIYADDRRIAPLE